MVVFRGNASPQHYMVYHFCGVEMLIEGFLQNIGVGGQYVGGEDFTYLESVHETIRVHNSIFRFTVSLLSMLSSVV